MSICLLQDINDRQSRGLSLNIIIKLARLSEIEKFLDCSLETVLKTYMGRTCKITNFMHTDTSPGLLQRISGTNIDVMFPGLIRTKFDSLNS